MQAHEPTLSAPIPPPRILEYAMMSVADMKLFLDETVEEMEKVTWPDWPQLKNSTIVILIFVVLVSAIIWFMDLTVTAVLDLIMGLFGI